MRHWNLNDPCNNKNLKQITLYQKKISNFTRKLAQAKSNHDYGEIESEPFFSCHGYKMKLSVYLNEGPQVALDSWVFT